MVLSLLLQELNNERQRLKEIHTAWSNQASSPSAELLNGLSGLIDFLERFHQASLAAGLEGLSEYLSLVRELVQSSVLALCEPELCTPAHAQRIYLLGDWINHASNYLRFPGDAETVTSMAALLLAEPVSADTLSVQVAVNKLLAPQLPSDLDLDDAVSSFALDDSDFSLLTVDVDSSQLTAFLMEAPRQCAQLEAAVAAWSEGAASTELVQEALRAAHTLKGSGYILGLQGIGKMAHRLEDVLEITMQDAGRSQTPEAPLVQAVQDAVFCLQHMVDFLQGTDDAPADPAGIAQRLLTWIDWLVRQRSSDAGAPSQPIGVPTPKSETTVAPVATHRIGGLQLDPSHLDALIRRSSQHVTHNERIALMVQDSSMWLNELDNSNRLLIQGLQDMERLLGQRQAPSPVNVEATASFDALEFERFDALQSMARSLDERAHDNKLLLSRLHTVAEQSTNLLREARYGMADQRQDLLALRTAEVRTIVSRLKRTVHQTAIATGCKVALEVTGQDVRLDADVLQRLVEPLLHLLRNAVDHGIESSEERKVADKPETGAVRVDFNRDGQNVAIRITDDGRGLDLQAIAQKAVERGLLAVGTQATEAQLLRLVLQAGFSTRETANETSGRGIGLDIVNDRILQLNGQLEIDSVQGFGCQITLILPAVSGVRNALVVRCNGLPYAIPSQNTKTIIPAGSALFIESADRLDLELDGEKFLVQSLASWLNPGGSGNVTLPQQAEQSATVVLRGLDHNTALLVDAALDFRELMVQDAGRLTRSVGGLHGAAVMADGNPIFLLNIPALARTVGKPGARSAVNRLQIAQHRSSILVVDDSWTARLAMKQLLEDAGYQVETAADGNIALDSIRKTAPDLVITDLEMPNMNGLELTRKLRNYPLWAGIPLLMLSSRSAEKHQSVAMDAGVDQYLTKPYQDQDLLRQVRSQLLEVSTA